MARLFLSRCSSRSGDNPHYIVCVQFNGHGQIKNKVAIYLAGEITQFVDATPEQCGDAAYQPFKELEAEAPSSSLCGINWITAHAELCGSDEKHDG